MLRPTPLPPIPSETQRLGQMLYEPENVYRQIGDLFADAFCDEQFAAMYSPLGQPALSPALLSLVSILQYLEHLSDRQALVMVRSRIDWKYALHLPLEAPGFDPSVLCEFRTRLVEHEEIGELPFVARSPLDRNLADLVSPHSALFDGDGFFDVTDGGSLEPIEHAPLAVDRVDHMNLNQLLLRA